MTKMTRDEFNLNLDVKCAVCGAHLEPLAVEVNKELLQVKVRTCPSCAPTYQRGGIQVYDVVPCNASLPGPKWHSGHSVYVDKLGMRYSRERDGTWREFFGDRVVQSSPDSRFPSEDGWHFSTRRQLPKDAMLVHQGCVEDAMTIVAKTWMFWRLLGTSYTVIERDKYAKR